MPYATINYGAPSQYPELSQQFQQIMRQIGAQNAQRQAQEQQMWYDAVAGGIGNVADAYRTGVTSQYNRRNQLADQQTQQNYAIDRMRQSQAINSGYNDWNSLVADAQRMGLNPSEAIAYRQAGAETIRGQAQTELALQRQSRLWEQQYGQSIAEQAARSLEVPVLGQDIIQKAQTSLTKPQQDEFFGAIKQWGELYGQLATDKPMVARETVIPEINRQRQVVGRYMREIQMQPESQQAQFDKSIVTRNGIEYTIDGKGNAKPLEGAPIESPSIRYNKARESLIAMPDDLFPPETPKEMFVKKMDEDERKRVETRLDQLVQNPEQRKWAIYRPRTDDAEVIMPKPDPTDQQQAKNLNATLDDIEKVRNTMMKDYESLLKSWQGDVGINAKIYEKQGLPPRPTKPTEAEVEARYRANLAIAERTGQVNKEISKADEAKMEPLKNELRALLSVPNPPPHTIERIRQVKDELRRISGR